MKFIIISGCSGGGKSSLIQKLEEQGYSTVPEVGRQIVQEQLEIQGEILPWKNHKLFCEAAIERAIKVYQTAQAKQIDHLIFFDRSLLDNLTYNHFHLKNDKIDNTYLVHTYKYNPHVFMVPPWPEIFCLDADRQHTLAAAIKEYEELLAFYKLSGYQIVELPKVSIDERVKFIEHFLGQSPNLGSRSRL